MPERLAQIPLFPLHTVLFPGGPLPLRIFESRYLDMISRCLKADSPFGILLIRDGIEAGQSTTHEVGTLAKVADWNQGSDGVLGVTVVGEKRFRLLSSDRQADGLCVGDIEIIEDEGSSPLPQEFKQVAGILAVILGDLGRLYDFLDEQYEDASWVGYRFAEILPIEPMKKQWCLETSDPIERLQVVAKVLKTVRGVEELA
jgi:Lon protease-like protein